MVPLRLGRDNSILGRLRQPELHGRFDFDSEAIPSARPYSMNLHAVFEHDGDVGRREGLGVKKVLRLKIDLFTV